ncbi:hypothetical protein Tco_1294820 [Tanacetum coccineum]
MLSRAEVALSAQNMAPGKTAQVLHDFIILRQVNVAVCNKYSCPTALAIFNQKALVYNIVGIHDKTLFMFRNLGPSAVLAAVICCEPGIFMS